MRSNALYLVSMEKKELITGNRLVRNLHPFVLYERKVCTTKWQVLSKETYLGLVRTADTQKNIE